MATPHHPIIVSAFLLFCCFSVTVVGRTGTATFYTAPYTPSACNGFKNDGVMIAAASNELWGNGAACGNKYKVKCLSGTNAGVPHPCKHNTDVVVTIVDFCPPGCQGTLDLSQEAFAKIADRNEGKINIDFQQVYGIKPYGLFNSL